MLGTARKLKASDIHLARAQDPSYIKKKLC